MIEESGICAEGRRDIGASGLQPPLAVGRARARQAPAARGRETALEPLPDRSRTAVPESAPTRSIMSPNKLACRSTQRAMGQIRACDVNFLGALDLMDEASKGCIEKE